jgi:transcriptional regulator with XRE-family HTH domain
LDTLAKIAQAMDVPIARFFATPGGEEGKNLPHLSEDEVRFLAQLRRYSAGLTDNDRKLVLAMVKNMAASSKK